MLHVSGKQSNSREEGNIFMDDHSACTSELERVTSNSRALSIQQDQRLSLLFGNSVAAAQSNNSNNNNNLFNNETVSFASDDKNNAVSGNSERSKSGKPRARARGGVVKPFPVKLHELLSKVDEEGFADVISWQPHGRSFVIYKPKQFVEDVMPKYFKQTKLTSFQRQLNLYDFSRLAAGPDRGGYYHKFFLRGRPDLCERITRQPVKGASSKLLSLITEPNFYAMEPCHDGTIPSSQAAKAKQIKSHQGATNIPHQSLDRPQGNGTNASFVDFLERYEAFTASQKAAVANNNITDLNPLEPRPIPGVDLNAMEPRPLKEEPQNNVLQNAQFMTQNSIMSPRINEANFNPALLQNLLQLNMQFRNG